MRHTILALLLWAGSASAELVSYTLVVDQEVCDAAGKGVEEALQFYAAENTTALEFASLLISRASLVRDDPKKFTGMTYAVMMMPSAYRSWKDGYMPAFIGKAAVKQCMIDEGKDYIVHIEEL